MEKWGSAQGSMDQIHNLIKHQDQNSYRKEVKEVSSQMDEEGLVGFKYVKQDELFFTKVFGYGLSFMSGICARLGSLAKSTGFGVGQ